MVLNIVPPLTPPHFQVIVSTNRGEPLVLQKNLSLSGIAYENAARRLVGRQVWGSGSGQAQGGLRRL